MTTEVKPLPVLTDTDLPAIITGLRESVGLLTPDEAAVLLETGRTIILMQFNALTALVTAVLTQQLGAEGVKDATEAQINDAAERAGMVLQVGLLQVAETMPSKVTKAVRASRVQP